MSKIDLVIELDGNIYDFENTIILENTLQNIGLIKHKLPMINSLVVEIEEENMAEINKILGITCITQKVNISTQMNIARKVVACEYDGKNSLTGKGITVAVIDTGISPVDDLKDENGNSRIIGFKDFVNGFSTAYDDCGHGTHVAGIIAGNGSMSNNKFKGIAPDANLIGIKALDYSGSGGSDTVLAGIQWVIDNKDKYNIKILNLSVGTPLQDNNDPLVKAAEAAWDNGIVVVTAAGNEGPENGTITSPGVSKKVITVGASDDMETVSIKGDLMENFSSRGPTNECVIKPDVIAPGANITSCLSLTPNPSLMNKKEITVVGDFYIKMSGTSMSTPIVTGAICILLEEYPDLTPNQVKLALKNGSVSMNFTRNQEGWGLVNIERLIKNAKKNINNCSLPLLYLFIKKMQKKNTSKVLNYTTFTQNNIDVNDNNLDISKTYLHDDGIYELDYECILNSKNK